MAGKKWTVVHLFNVDMQLFMHTAYIVANNRKLNFNDVSYLHHWSLCQDVSVEPWELGQTLYQCI